MRGVITLSIQKRKVGKALPFLLQPVSRVAEKVGNFTAGNP
jgi:hypothetical protein